MVDLRDESWFLVSTMWWAWMFPNTHRGRYRMPARTVPTPERWAREWCFPVSNTAERQKFSTSDGHDGAQ